MFLYNGSQNRKKLDFSHSYLVQEGKRKSYPEVAQHTSYTLLAIYTRLPTPNALHKIIIRKEKKIDSFDLLCFISWTCCPPNKSEHLKIKEEDEKADS